MKIAYFFRPVIGFLIPVLGCIPGGACSRSPESRLPAGMEALLSQPEALLADGFHEAGEGLTIRYPSFLGEEKDALIVRADVPAGTITWTMMVPDSLPDTVDLVIETGLATHMPSHAFYLYLNDRNLSALTNTPDPGRPFESEPGVTTRFLSLARDQYDDAFGYLWIRIPRVMLDPNRMAQFKIVSEDAGSPAWIMIFKETKAADVLNTLRRDRLAIRFARISYAQTDVPNESGRNEATILWLEESPADAVICLKSQGYPECTTSMKLYPGLNKPMISVPNLLSEIAVDVKCDAGERTVSFTQTLPPVVPASAMTKKPFRFSPGKEKTTPFPPSEEYGDIRFSGRYRNYTNADTWYPTWADDDQLYSPWTDGYILDAHTYTAFDQSHPGYACNSLDFDGRPAATAQARIRGDDPLNLIVENIPPRIPASPVPFGGHYPCGSLIYNGVWYYGTYCLTDNPGDPCDGVGWSQFGPFVGFRYSMDYGKTWTESPRTPSNPLFSELPGESNIKIGSPHFVDFGRNMEHSPDGLAYLTAHGSADPASCTNWIQGDDIYLLRVHPSVENINDPKAYEFFSGDENGTACWTKDFTKIKPLLSWAGHLGCVTATFNKPLGRYLMCITRGTSALTGNTMILEADAITGPWRLIRFLEDFGPFAYFVNVPSKFIGNDGITFWLSYSANFNDKRSAGNPVGSFYSLSLHEVSLEVR